VFVLRIEDTDKERNSEEYLNLIYDSLTWLGLNWDEGPGSAAASDPTGRVNAPAIYKEYVQKLVVAGRAYEKDGATWFKLIGERSEIYDEHRKKTVTKVKTAPFVIEDLIRGRVERVEDEDFVIVRSDGHPVFHLVNVVGRHRHGHHARDPRRRTTLQHQASTSPSYEAFWRGSRRVRALPRRGSRA